MTMLNHGPPQTLMQLKSQIVAGDIVLSGALQKAAAVAFDAPDRIAFETRNLFAQRSGVAIQTVDRLSHQLGYRNFREFRNLFRDHLRKHPAHGDRAACTQRSAKPNSLGTPGRAVK
ncbi:MurR/RpiR family transcriptional regulator [Shinella sp.]|uniref:MurR/RpiR family transcriptional regulator n=1 Tax=Shinella sp. TaxID=1870904 RepID=UPI00403531E9